MVLFLEEPKQPTAKTASSETASISPIMPPSPLVENINEFWKGSILEGKAQTLIDACSTSTVPDMCAKVIAVQTKFETSFGTDGTGRSHLKNLTGIRKNGTWKNYLSYDDSLRDHVWLFINKNHEDYFTLYDDGLCRYLTNWGTNHCDQISSIVKSL